MSETSFGPWAADITEAERAARRRELRAIVYLLVGPRHPLYVAPQCAESDPAAAKQAPAHLEALPPLRRRRVLSIYAALAAPLQGKGTAND